MAALTTQQIAPAGTTLTFGAAAGGGDTLTPGDTTFLYVKNGGGSPITVTIDDPNSVGPSGAAQFNPDLSVSVTNGSEKCIGPLSATRFGRSSDGQVAITYSAVTSVTVAAVRI